MDDWSTEWSRVIAGAPAGSRPVAVVYADWREAESPSPEAVLAVAVESAAAALLVDTFGKDGRTLLDHLSIAQLGEFVHHVRGAGLTVVLAGSLTLTTLPAILPLSPDLIAVRGAVCQGSRRGSVDTFRVAELKQLLATSRSYG